ncbi:hypothetical protein MauCBS54593_007062 [Microsporum audouinii]
MATPEGLPLEVLQQICGYVASDYRPSLYDFALVCKRWSVASNAIRFQRIRLTIKSHAKLSEDLDHWNNVLHSTSSFRSIRRLEIEGELPAEGSMWVVNRRERSKNCMVDRDDEFESMQYTDYRTLSELPEVTMELDKYWRPLAHFVVQLRALQDLIFNCTNQFPPCLLDVSHHIIPNCRLHLHSFGLRNLYSYKGWQRDLDQYEYALATSPSLYCITLLYEGGDPDRLINYHDLAIARMSEGLAPNLRHIRVIVHSLSKIMYNRRTEQRPKRDIFPNNTPNPDSYGELHTIKFSGILFGGLQQWNEHIAFSALKELILDTMMDPYSLREASTYNFRSLKTLFLRLDSDNLDENAFLDGAACVFLQSLPPLNVLKLTGNFSHETFKAILGHHRSLQRIWLSPQRKSHLASFGLDFTLSLDRIRELTSQCLQLRTVSLLIPRTLGDSQEVNIYRALGSLPRLKDLSLYLDCFCHAEPYMGAAISNDKPENFAVIKNILMNAALDETLARAIFQEVYRTQSTLGLPVLQRLRVQAVGVRLGESTPEDLRNILDVTSCGWAIIMNPTHRDGCREITAQQHRPRHITGALNPKFIIYQKAFRSVWPAKSDTWQTDWHSLPLATDENMATRAT